MVKNIHHGHISKLILNFDLSITELQISWVAVRFRVASPKTLHTSLLWEMTNQPSLIPLCYQVRNINSVVASYVTRPYN